MYFFFNNLRSSGSVCRRRSTTRAERLVLGLGWVSDGEFETIINDELEQEFDEKERKRER